MQQPQTVKELLEEISTMKLILKIILQEQDRQKLIEARLQQEREVCPGSFIERPHEWVSDPDGEQCAYCKVLRISKADIPSPSPPPRLS